MARENHLYYTPDAEGMAKIERLRLKVIELDDLIDELTGHNNNANPPPGYKGALPIHVGRPVSIAKTKLEECRQRAIEAIVRLHAKPQEEKAA